LDPGACGVLPITIGKATKVSDFIINTNKEYIFELTPGISTDTLDDEGAVVEKRPVTKENISELIRTYQDFIGTCYQSPPMYSAIKKKGKKLYEYARAGETVAREKREVKIFDLKILDRYTLKDMERFLFKVECSKGTYIRVLAEDLARKAGTAGYMSFLLRTGTGDFRIENSVRLEDFVNQPYGDKLKKYILPMDKALMDFPYIILDSRQSKMFVNGNLVKYENDQIYGRKDENYCSGALFYRVYDLENYFLGLGKIMDQQKIKPEKVLV